MRAIGRWLNGPTPNEDEPQLSGCGGLLRQKSRTRSDHFQLQVVAVPDAKLLLVVVSTPPKNISVNVKNCIYIYIFIDIFSSCPNRPMI